MSSFQRAPILEIVDKIVGNYVAQPESVAIIFVLSVLGKSDIRDDYEGFSISASFQKQNDLEDYIFTFREAGFYVQTFLNEREFFSWVLAGGYSELGHTYKFVYTSAVNGTGPGRRALVPAFCSHMGIPTLNQNPYSSTIGRHKHNVAQLLSGLGVPAAKCWLIDSQGTWLGDCRPDIGEKVIAKATYEGSSIGVDANLNLNYTRSLDDAYVELARRLRQPITIQQFLEGDEFEVPVFACNGHIEACPLAVIDDEGIISGDRFLDYEKVWTENYGYSSAVSSKTRDILQRLATSAYAILGYSNVARIDFRLMKDGSGKVFDVSGTPDLTKMSSCASAIRLLGGQYVDLWLLALAATVSNSS